MYGTKTWFIKLLIAVQKLKHYLKVIETLKGILLKSGLFQIPPAAS
jgi:hypothetical protein